MPQIRIKEVKSMKKLRRIAHVYTCDEEVRIAGRLCVLDNSVAQTLSAWQLMGFVRDAGLGGLNFSLKEGGEFTATYAQLGEFLSLPVIK
ncbi:hypothetical protein JXA34_03355 [Patescibacteria group bacterium]|nr:hypothetical protein [Patescibacteria group bacterium]